MKRTLILFVITLLLSTSLLADEIAEQYCFLPHFQANIDIKALGTKHIIHSGDFSILRPYGKGFNLDMPAGGSGIDVTLGYRLKEYFFIGGGFSFQWWLNTDSKNHWSYDGILPVSNDVMSRYGMAYALYAVPRFYISTTNMNVTPYIDFGLGFCQFFLMMKDHGEQQYTLDLYCHAGLGVDIHRFNIRAGYQYSYNSNGYLSIGYRF